MFVPFLDELSRSQALTYFTRSQGSYKGQYRTHPRFWYQKHLCEIWKQSGYFFMSYRVHKQSWPWPICQGHRGHTRVNIELVRDFDPRKTSVKFESDWNISWQVIAFTSMDGRTDGQTDRRTDGQTDRQTAEGTTIPVGHSGRGVIKLIDRAPWMWDKQGHLKVIVWTYA